VAVLTEKIFTFVWYADSSRRATIRFVWNPEKDRFEFKYCGFITWKSINSADDGVEIGAYSFDDWQFLNALSAQIIELDRLEHA